MLTAEMQAAIAQMGGLRRRFAPPLCLNRKGPEMLDLSRRRFLQGLVATAGAFAMPGLPARALDAYMDIPVEPGTYSISCYMRPLLSGPWYRVARQVTIKRAGNYRYSLRRMHELSQGLVGELTRKDDDWVNITLHGNAVGVPWLNAAPVYDLGDMQFQAANHQMNDRWPKPLSTGLRFDEAEWRNHNEATMASERLLSGSSVGLACDFTTDEPAMVNRFPWGGRIIPTDQKRP